MNENMKTMNEEQQAANSREVYEAPKCEIIGLLKYRMKACCAAAITVPHTVVLKTATK